MNYLVVLIFVFLPRCLIILLKLMTSWFVKVFQGWFWIILGVIFAPYTLLWYSVVQNWFQGQWKFLQIFVLILTIIADLISLTRLKPETD